MNNKFYNDLVGLILNGAVFAYGIWSSFFWWFRSKVYISMNQKKRKEYRKKLFLMPQTFMFGYYDKNPQFEIWINRMVGLVFILVSLAAIFLALYNL
jgi:hypothetical protein